MQVLKCALPKFPEQLLWTSQSTDKLVTFRISEITKILEYLHCTKTLVLHSRFHKQTNKKQQINFSSGVLKYLDASAPDVIVADWWFWSSLF